MTTPTCGHIIKRHTRRLYEKNVFDRRCASCGVLFCVLTTAKTLSISGANEGAIDGDHTITTGTNSFTLKDYLAFGMPQTTEWTKQ